MEIGKINNLKVKSESSIGFFLSDGEQDVLLPRRHAPRGLTEGKEIDVFIYNDNEGRPVATSETPYAQLGDFAFLEVKQVNEYGAYLDWGISKDMFVAFPEQRTQMNPGEKHLVYIFRDELSGRLAATARWSRFLEAPFDMAEGDEVQLLIAEETDLGWRAIIDNHCEGLLYKNEVFTEIHPGDVMRGYIKQIRPDDKIDLRLQAEGMANIENASVFLEHYLEQHNGILNLGDKSSPDEIYALLKMSKKSFKKAAGALYRQRKITIDDHEIRATRRNGGNGDKQS
jgi:predicted RNA-binding protein (virulence factor B family)